MDLQNEELFSWFSLFWFTPDTLLNYFSWENPQILYLLFGLPAFFLVRFFILWKIRSRMEVSFPDKILKKDLTSILRILPGLFFILSLSLIIIALARPQKTTEKIEQITNGIDIMLIMDISKSMEALDLKPNRLEAAKKTASKFILGRIQDRIGIVVFSGEAFSLSPLTSDYDLLKYYIKEINFNMIVQGGTAIGSALAVGINRLKESKADSKIIILLSDGDNNAGNIDPNTAAKLAAAYEMKVYTILVGKEKGMVPMGTDMFGNVQYAPAIVDPTTLANIAQITNGIFYKAANNKALNNIFSNIDHLEKSEIKINKYKNTKDYYDVYLKWGLLSLLLWFVCKNTFLNNFLQD